MRHAIVNKPGNDSESELQRPVIVTQQQRVQQPGYWIGQGGREIEDTTVTRYGFDPNRERGPSGGSIGTGASYGPSGAGGPGQGGPNGSNPHILTGPLSKNRNQPYQNGKPQASPRTVPPNQNQAQNGPNGPQFKTDVHGVRTDYIGKRDGRWIERRGYEITREDLNAPKVWKVNDF